MVLMNQRNLKKKRLKKYYYRFEVTCKKTARCEHNKIKINTFNYV